MHSSCTYRGIIFCVCFLAGTFAGMDANLFSMTLPQIIQSVYGQTDRMMAAQWGSYATAALLLGWTIGGIGLGAVSDRIGRVYGLALSIALYAGATVLAAMVQHMPYMIALRFFVGMGVGGTLVAMSVFISESWSSSSKTIAIGILIASYQAGVFLSGFVVHISTTWQASHMMGALALLLVLPTLWFFQEPKQSSQKESQVEGAETNSTYRLLVASAIFGSLLIGYWASVAWIPSWIEDLQGGGTGHYEKNIATMIHGMCAICGCIIVGVLAQTWSRKVLIGFSYLGALVLSWAMFLGHSSFSETIYVLNGMLGLCIGMAQAIMYIYLPELFPVRSRATQVGICLNAGRLATIAAVLLVGVIMTYFSSYAEALSFFASIYIVGAMLALVTPETGRT